MEECQFTISPTTKIYLAPLTFIGATTEIGIVPKPIVDRFSYLIDMPTYSIEELRLITNNMAKSSGIDIDEPAAKLIATICKSSPRIIRNILGICVDITVVKDKTKITEDIVREYMHNYGVLNDEGLTETDLKVLKVLNTSGSIGKESIISMTQINKEEYRYIIEPFLLEKGYMTLTKSGRVISDKGKTLFA
jgi:Holliday junction DNA helicase RuvB